MPRYEKLDVQLTRPAGLEDFKVQIVNINATPTLVSTTGFTGRRGVIIYAPESGTVFVGKTGVTAATGIPVPAGSSPLQLDFHTTEGFPIYAIADSGSLPVRVVEFK